MSRQPKRFLSILLTVLLVLSGSFGFRPCQPVSAAGPGVFTEGNKLPYDMRLSGSYNYGSGISGDATTASDGYINLHRMFIDGQPSFCLMSGTETADSGSSMNQGTVSLQTVLGADKNQRLGLIAWYGYYSKPSPTDWDYFLTQAAIYRTLGMTVVAVKGCTMEAYQAAEQALDAKVAGYSVNPSYNNTEITLLPGKSVTLTDTTNATSELRLRVNTANVDVKLSGNTVTLTAKPDSTDGLVSFGKIPDTFIGDSTFFTLTSGGWIKQTQGVIRYPYQDPLYGNIRVAIEKTGSLRFTKVNRGGGPFTGAQFQIKDSQGAVQKLSEISSGVYTVSPAGTLDRFTVSAQGQAEIRGLLAGAYRIAELVPPVGALKAPDVSVVINAGESAQASMTDDTQSAKLIIRKTDQATGKALAGAVFRITGPGLTGDTYTTGPDGTVTSNAYPVSATPYTVTEITPPTGYAPASPASQTVLLKGDTSSTVLTFTAGFANQRQTARFTLQKTDAVTGETAQGEGRLKGAVYHVICVSLLNPENSPYKVGAVAATLTTDDKGRATSPALELGTYDVVETQASPGYALNKTAVRVTLAYDKEGGFVSHLITQDSRNSDALIAGLNAQIDALNQAIDSNRASRPHEPHVTAKILQEQGVIFAAEKMGLARFELQKHTDSVEDFPHSGPRPPEAGIVFEVRNAQGAVVDTLTTNANGYATSKLLPAPGTYQVHQVNTSDPNVSKVKDFTVVFTAGQQIKNLILENFKQPMRLKLVKEDAETGKTLPIPGVTFNLKDAAGKPVVQHVYYPEMKTLTEFQTNADGVVILPELLSAGDYSLTEIKGPRGYVLPEGGKAWPLHITAKDIQDENTLLVTFTVKNQPIKGVIELTKEGDLFQGWQKDAGGVFRPVMKKGLLLGSTFALSAAEDIVGAEGTVFYKKGQLVETLVTNDKAPVRSQPLRLGSYTLTETKVPEGYVPAPAQTVTLTQEEPSKAIVVKTAAAFNRLQTTTVSFDKRFETSRWFKHEEEAPGQTVFGLFTAEPLTIQGHSLPKDSLVGETRLSAKTRDGKPVTETGTEKPVTVEKSRPLAGAELEVMPETGQDKSPLHFEKQPDGRYAYLAKPEAPQPETETLKAPTEPETVTPVPVPEPVKAEPKLTETMTAAEKEKAIADAKAQNEQAQADYDAAVKAAQAAAEKVNAKARADYAAALQAYRAAKAAADAQAQAAASTYQTALARWKQADAKITTDAQGKVMLTGLPEGAYRFRSLKVPVGFKPVLEENVAVTRSPNEEETRLGKTFAEITTETVLPAKTSAEKLWTGRFAGLLPGKYYLKELSTGEAYALSGDTPVAVAYKPQGQAQESQTIEKPIENKLIAGSVTVVKTGNEKGTPLPGAKFRLVAVKDGKEQTVGEFTTDDRGRIVVKNLEVGTYYLQEVTPPKGYYLNDEKIPVAISRTVCNPSLEIKDNETVAVISKELLNGKALPGAKMQIRDANGKVVAAWISGDAPHEVRGLIAGERYILHEEASPHGFLLSKDVPFTVDLTGKVRTPAKLTDDLDLQLTKTDVTDGRPVPGAEIIVQDQNGKPVCQGVTDAQGKIRLTGLMPGERYSFKETAAPRGYALNTRTFSFAIDEDGKVTGVTRFTDEPTALLIQKRDENGAALAGAGFTLLNEAGTPLRFTLKDGLYLADADGICTEIIVDAAGRAELRYLPVGTYTLRETTVPDGYQKAADITLTLSGSHGISAPLNLAVENKRIPPKPELPKTGEKESPLLPVSGTGLMAAGILGLGRRRKRRWNADGGEARK